VPKAGKTTPEYQKIAGDLHRAVNGGKFKPGARLPAERELMTQYGVSRTTVRQALAALSADGLTESRRGSGTVVREYQPVRRIANDRLSPDRWSVGRSVWQSDKGDRIRPEDMTAKEVPAPDPVAAALAVSPGTPVMLRTVVHRLDGRPVQRSRCYVPRSLIDGTPLADGDPTDDTYVHLAAAGRTPVRTREEVRSRMPAAIERSALGVSAGTPVLLLAVTAFDADDKPVEVTEVLLDASTFILEYNVTS